MNETGVDLLWIPLGAGGHFVKLNGRVYEFFRAHSEHRPVRDLYHTALEVRLPEGHFVIENAWPIPKGDGAARGVTIEGPVWMRGLGRLRAFRYEIRCWDGGTIADRSHAVAIDRVTDDDRAAHNLLALTHVVPGHLWGRKPRGYDEMWNSNSVTSWLLTRAGADVAGIAVPAGGQAPGWTTGVRIATREGGSLVHQGSLT